MNKQKTSLYPNKWQAKRAIVSVINDLSTDQRVARTCSVLHSVGYQTTLVGRRLKNSIDLAQRPYHCHRLRLCFTKGPLFYFIFQIRLLCFLLKQPKAQLYFANDLDTLLPMYLVAKLKKGTIVYDSHELFTEVPELLHSPVKRWLWLSLERILVPKVDAMITVNQSIADIFSNKYQRQVFVVRNIPVYSPVNERINKEKLRQALKIPLQPFVIILQGAGINIHRGAEEALEAMQYIPNAILLIVGSGDVIEQLKQMRKQLQLQDKVIITGKVPYQELKQYTMAADLGISLDRDTNLNYRYSLPNKLFDYIHANVPVLSTRLVEIARIIEEYKIGICVEEVSPIAIAKAINTIIRDKQGYQEWMQNLPKAQKELNWQTEAYQLKAAIKNGLSAQKKT